MVKRRRLSRAWKPRVTDPYISRVDVIALSEDELFTGWWTEGSTPFRKNRSGTVKRIVYLSQKGDRAFMEWWSDQISEEGYRCTVREKDKDDFELEGDLGSAWRFHSRIIEPRKAKLPLHKKRVHELAMKVLPRQISRGMGKKIRSQLK
ncbi:MAG: hypothetical protein OK449_00345 [Thaumarchaeota archaeon]|nr:hypothetical protein [Nitrososphaerota archaeon]